MFYGMYRGVDSFPLIYCLLLVIPFVTHFKTNLNTLNGFQNLIVERTGWRRYFFDMIQVSIKEIWYIPILVNLFSLALIHFCAYPLFGGSTEVLNEPHQYFISNAFWNLVLATVFQIFSWSLLNCYCFLYAQIARNKYLYPLMLVITVLGVNILVTVIGSALHLVGPENWVLNIFLPLELIAPGMISLIYLPSGPTAILVVVLNLALYTIILYFLGKRVLKTKFRNG